MTKRVFYALCALGALSSAACDMLKPPPPKPFEARLRVFGDPGQPLKGAEVFYKQKRIGVTDDAGTVNFRLKGAEGEVYELNVKCPSGFQSPPKPLSVTLRKTADPATRPEYEAECPKASRTVVVAVRADSGPNLPILFLGREVSKTDQSGSAHVMLDVPPNQMFQLQLSTDGVKGLTPTNPAQTFEVKQADEVFVFDQKFKQEKKRVYGGRPKSTGPKPL